MNADGTLKLEKITSIDELRDEDFSAPTRNVELPALPRNVDEAIGANGKPVIIKKNIFERNAKHHAELTAEDSRNILQSALYNANLYGQNQKAKRPYNWVVINTKDKEGNNRLVLIELSSVKENAEIVHWHYIDNKGLEKIQLCAHELCVQLHTRLSLPMICHTNIYYPEVVNFSISSRFFRKKKPRRIFLSMGDLVILTAKF